MKTIPNGRNIFMEKANNQQVLIEATSHSHAL